MANDNTSGLQKPEETTALGRYERILDLAPSEVVTNVQKLLKGGVEAFRQRRTYERAMTLFLADVIGFGRHTVTEELRALGLTEWDWSAYYRLFGKGRIDEEKLSGYLVQETLVHVDAQEPYLAVVDGTRIMRTGKHVAGSGWWPAQNTAPFKRGLMRGQRFVGTAWLTPPVKGECRAIPLRWIPAPTAKSVACEAKVMKEWEAGIEGVRWLRKTLNEAGRREQRLMVVADGSFEAKGVWNELPAQTTLLVRTAKNRALYRLPPPPAGGKGHPTWYGERLPNPGAYTRKRKGFKTTVMNLRGRQIPLKYKVEGPLLVEGAHEHPLFLIVVSGSQWVTGKRKRRICRRKPAFYLVSAVKNQDQWQLPFAEEQLLAWAWHRWETEVSHRDMKSAWGVGDKQCWANVSAIRAVQWDVWTFSVLLLAGYRSWGVSGGPRRNGRWYPQARRWSFTTVWQACRAAFWRPASLLAAWSEPAHKPVVNEAAFAALWRTVACAARI